MKKEKIITSICLFVIFLMFCSIIANKIYKSKHEEASDIIETNWEKFYPFENTETKIQRNDSNNIMKKIENKINEYYETNNYDIFKTYIACIKRVESKIEETFNEQILCRINFVELNGKILKITNQKYIKGKEQIVNIKDGYLAYIEEKRNTIDIANNLIDFSKYLIKNNIDLLYVQAPDKINKFDQKQFLNGYKNYSNDNTDNFISIVKKANIDVLDLRDEIHNKYSNEQYSKLFYKADHHWLPETGIWATQILGNHLNNNYEFNINTKVYNTENYNIEKYEKWILGSMGRKVTLGYAKPEDFEVYYPKFKTNFHVKVPSIGIEKRGDFYNALIYQKNLKENDAYKRSTYLAYGYGDQAIINIDNINIRKGKKVLMIKDSFADVVYPYLAIGTKELDIIDLRYFNGSLQTYINGNKPDIVIMMYNPSSLVNENYSTANTNTFDFR